MNCDGGRSGPRPMYHGESGRPCRVEIKKDREGRNGTERHQPSIDSLIYNLVTAHDHIGIHTSASASASASASEEKQTLSKMPKKMGVNTKAEAARARKSAAETERKEKETREKVDQYWLEAEGSKSRAAKKKEEEAEKRAEAASRRAEARRLAEQEEKELEKAMKKVDKKANRVSIPVPKVTEVELRRRREEEQAQAERKAEEVKKRQSRTAAEDEYERMVLVSNTNRDDSIIEARSLDDAIAQMTIVDNLPPDRHPERRLKASFKAFEEAELPKLKEEKPGLTHNQYKDLIWKLWKKSPDNPLNQIAE